MRMKIINGQEVTAKLSAALRDIARLTGFSEKDVTIQEAGSILKACASRTKLAKVAQVELRSRQRALQGLGLTRANNVGDMTINVGIKAKAGRLWVKTQSKVFKLAGTQSFDADSFTPMNYHWKNAKWQEIQNVLAAAASAINRERPLGLASIGLARQSWIQIADSLGMPLEKIPGGRLSNAAIEKARRSIASNGKYYVNGRADKVQEPSRKFFVTLINSLPYHSRAGLDEILAGVIAGRVGLYRRTFANGAYKSIEASSRNYPWMKARMQGLAA